MKYFCAAIFTICNLTLFSQHTFKARVIDEETKEPLIGASALVKGTIHRRPQLVGTQMLTRRLLQHDPCDVLFRERTRALR